MSQAEITKYLARIGRKGGKATGGAKAEAARLNATKPRPNRRKNNRPRKENKQQTK